MRNATAKAREIESDVYLPFGRHVTDTVISLSTRALITVIKMDGTSFETAEAADLNDLHAKLNLTLRNIADDRLALWSHLIRRQTSDYPSGTFRSTFSAALDAQYRERLRNEALFRNDLYLTLVWHPGRATTDAAAAFFKRLGRASGRSVEVDSEALKRLDDATRDVVAALERYGARAVGLVDRDGIVFSEAMEPPASGCRCHCRKDRSVLRSIPIASSSGARLSKSAARADHGSPACSGSRNIRRPPGRVC
jgi:type IV secretion system protein VirB4